MEDKKLRHNAVLEYLKQRGPTPVRTIGVALREKYGPWCSWATVCKKMAEEGLLQVENAGSANPFYQELPSWSVRQINLRGAEAFLGGQWRSIIFTESNCDKCPHAKKEEDGISCSYPIPVVNNDGFCYPHNVVLGGVKPTLEHSQKMRVAAEKFELDWRARHETAHHL